MNRRSFLHSTGLLTLTSQLAAQKATTQLAKDATAKGIVVLADVQCRSDEFFHEGMKHIHDAKPVNPHLEELKA